MIEGLIKQFTGSGEAAQVLSLLQKKGLTPQEAKSAVSATAESAAESAPELLGQSGVAGALGSMMGARGGGLGGVLGPKPGIPGVSPQLIDNIARTVAQKTGLPADKAKGAVKLILPRVIEFAKQKVA